MGQEIIGIIPVRSGSKRLPGKNRLLLPDTIRQCRNSTRLTRVVVSTDSEELAEVAKSEWTEVDIHMRPAHLAADHVQTEPVMIDVLDSLVHDPAAVVLLQVTSPLRTAEDIDFCIGVYLEGDCDSVMSVRRTRKFYWSDLGRPINYNPLMRPREQDAPPYWEENGAVYITAPRILREHRCRVGGRHRLVECFTNLQIDTEEDLHTWHALSLRQRSESTTKERWVSRKTWLIMP